MARPNSKRNSQISDGRGSTPSRPTSYHSHHSSPRGSLPDYKDLEAPPRPLPEADDPLVQGPGSKRSSLHGSKVDTRLEMDPDGGCYTVPDGDLLPPPEDQSKCTKAIAFVQKHVHDFLREKGPILKKVFVVALLVAYTVYLGFAIYTSPAGALMLIVLTAMIVTYLLLKFFWGRFGRKVHAATCGPLGRLTKRRWWKYCRW